MRVRHLLIMYMCRGTKSVGLRILFARGLFQLDRRVVHIKGHLE
jgi:hypothetical protein